MRNKRWKCKLLSLALCASLTVPCFSAPVYASEAEPVVVQAEESVFAEEETKNESLENMEVMTTLGTFENVKVLQNGFYLSVEGKYKSTASLNGERTTLYLVQYDKEEQKLLSTQVYEVYFADEVTYSLNRDEAAPLLSNTEYVRLEVVRGDVRECSEKISCTELEKPEVSFEVKNSNTAASLAWFEVTYSGDMQLKQGKKAQNVNFAFNVGTSEEKESWNVVSAQGVYYREGKMESVKCDYLNPDTTYYGELIVFVERCDDESQGEETKFGRSFEQRIPLKPFTTEKNVVYSWEKEFTDEAFREDIKNAMYNMGYTVSDNEVTAAQLEGIRDIELDRYNLSECAIKDLTGIQLLKGLMFLEVNNHEVADVSSIDWSVFKSLLTFRMKGNELTKLPDLSKNSQLSSWDLRENKLSDAELEKAESYLPSGFEFDESYTIEETKETQRTNGYSVLLEDNYYVYSNGTHIFVQPKGYKTGFAYTMKWYLNGVETEFRTSETSDGVKLCYVINSGLTEGKHTLKGELYQGETKIDETEEYSINVVNQPIFATSNTAYISEDTRQNYLWSGNLYYDISGIKAESVELIDDKGKVFGKIDVENIGKASREPRFKNFQYAYPVEDNISLQSVYCPMEYIYNTTPAGNYHLKVYFSDGSTEIVENVFVSLPRTEPVILSCYMNGQYDNTGDYLYIGINGVNLEPAKYSYHLDEHYPVSYVAHRNTMDGVIVQLKKDGWKRFAEDDWSIDISIEGDTEATCYQSSFGYNINSGVYYSQYNIVKDKLEMAVTSDLRLEGKKAKINLRIDKAEDAPVVAQTEVVLGDEMMLVDFDTPDGTDYLFENGDYYGEMEVDSKFYNFEFWVYGVYRVEATGLNEDLDDGIDVMSVEEILVTPDNHYIIESAENESKEVAEELSVQEVETAAVDKFIVKNIDANWINPSEISVSVESPSVKEGDKYTVTLVDQAGIQPTGLTTTYSISEERYIYFTITGLERKDAAKEYYIKITHDTLGEPYDVTGKDYFYLDSRGACMDITRYTMSWSSIDERMTALHLSGEILPIKLQIYKPYSMELVHEVDIENSDLMYGSYYFSKEFCEKLPVKDVNYELVINGADNRVSGGIEIIGCEEELRIPWKYSIDRTVLYTNGEAGKTAVIEVTGNKEKPTFKSSNTNAVTVKVDDSNPNKAVLTAVGLGESQISISVDGFTRRFMVSAERKVNLERITLSSTNMVLGMGESRKLAANVFPAEAWKEDMEITFQTENNDIIAIEGNGTDGEVMLRGLKPGTAVVTVAITGTELKAQCTVTVENEYSAEEYRALIAEAGNNYVLVNAYPQKAVTLKDVTLPEGWTWADASVKLAADDQLPVQYYTAEYKKEGYRTIRAALPVAVSELLSVNVTGKTLLSPESMGVYHAECEYKGYQPRGNELAASLQYQWSTETGKDGYVISQEGNLCRITTKKVTEDVVQKLTFTAKMGENKLSADLGIKVAGKPFVEQITFSVSGNQPEKAVKKFEYSISDNCLPEIIIDSKEVGKNSNELRIEVQGFAGKTLVTPEKGFQWNSSDTSMVKVKMESENSAILTIKKSGSAVITVTAQDEGMQEQEILISVKDYEPVLDKKLSFDIFAQNGTLIPVKAQNGNDVVSLGIQEQDAGTKEWKNSSKVEAVKDGEEFYIRAKSGYAPSKNEKIKAQINIKTVNGMEYAKAVTISVNAKTKPKASFKAAQKAHLLYKDATAVYNVVSKYEIASVEEVKDGKGFELVQSSVSDNVFVFEAKDLSAETLKDYKAKNSTLCQVNLKVKFKGYTEAADQLLTLKIATNNKIPTLKVKDVTIFYGQTKNETAINYVSPILPDGKAKIVSKTDGVGLRMAESGEVEVQYLLYKNKSYKAELTCENWTQSVPLKGKITVSNPAAQKMILDTPKITLNTAHNIQDNGKLKIGLSLKDNDTKIEKLSYQIDKKNAPLFNDGYLAITYSKKEQKAYVGLNKDLQGSVKPGTYKVNLIGKIRLNAQEYKLKAVTLTINLTDKEPVVNLKAKGSIDLTKRNSSMISYTPVYKNMMAVADSVKLSGIYAPYFNASVENGIVYVSAKEDYPMSAKITYPLTISLGLSNGEEKPVEVKIKPVSKLPKLKAEVTKATLLKSAAEELCSEVLTSDAYTSVDRIELVKDKNSQYFNFETEGNRIRVSLSEEAVKMKPGKYTLFYKVYPKGAAYDGKSAVLKLAVTVK